MTPASPVIPGHAVPETVYAKDQPPYTPLPVVKLNDDTGTVLSRWKLNWRERIGVLWSGDVYLWQMTFGDNLQPVKIETSKPEVTRSLPPAAPLGVTDKIYRGPLP